MASSSLGSSPGSSDYRLRQSFEKCRHRNARAVEGNCRVNGSVHVFPSPSVFSGATVRSGWTMKAHGRGPFAKAVARSELV